MKTEELKQRYRKAFGYGLWEDAEKGMISRDHEVLTFLQSEIEAAERRRTEDVVECLMAVFRRRDEENDGDWGRGVTDGYRLACETLKAKFLKNPEQ